MVRRSGRYVGSKKIAVDKVDVEISDTEIREGMLIDFTKPYNRFADSLSQRWSIHETTKSTTGNSKDLKETSCRVSLKS